MTKVYKVFGFCPHKYKDELTNGLVLTSQNQLDFVVVGGETELSGSFPSFKLRQHQFSVGIHHFLQLVCF